MNILVLGTKVLSSDVDNPPPETQDVGYHALVDSLEGLTDTMLLLRFDPLNEGVVVLSIPRDTRAYVPGMGMTKINAANVQGGPAMAAQVTSELLNDVGIDRYVVVNVQAVQKLIDALGGVQVYVPQAMRYQDDSQHLYINLEAGEQTLNGDQALQFLRFRYDSYGDIGRIQRQQMLLRALMEQTLNPRTISRLPDITNVIRTHVDTNLTMEELLALMGFASRTDRSQVQMLMLPGDFGSVEEYNTSYWLPNYDRIDDMVANYFNQGGITVSSTQSLPSPRSLRITVQNSSNDEGAADRLADTLYDQGYGNLFVDQDWPQVLATTRIIAQNGDRATAEQVQQALGFGEVRVESTGDLNSDVTILVGEDWTGN